MIQKYQIITYRAKDTKLFDTVIINYFFFELFWKCGKMEYLCSVESAGRSSPQMNAINQPGTVREVQE